MAKWYQKASVQAALAGGVFVLLAAIVTVAVGFFITPPREEPRPEPPSRAVIEIADVLYQHHDDQTGSLDFRLVNRGTIAGTVSRIVFELLEYSEEPLAGFHHSTGTYDLSLDSLHRIGQLSEIRISQVVPAGSSDRFEIRVAAPRLAAGSYAGYWRLAVSLLTSEGRVDGPEVEVRL